MWARPPAARRSGASIAPDRDGCGRVAPGRPSRVLTRPGLLRQTTITPPLPSPAARSRGKAGGDPPAIGERAKTTPTDRPSSARGCLPISLSLSPPLSLSLFLSLSLSLFLLPFLSPFLYLSYSLTLPPFCFMFNRPTCSFPLFLFLSLSLLSFDALRVLSISSLCFSLALPPSF